MNKKTKKLASVLLAIVLALAQLSLSMLILPSFAESDEVDSERGMNANISLSDTSISIKKGQAFKLTATVQVSGTVSWSSQNSSVATVTQYGLVVGVSSGSTYITATVSGSYPGTNTAQCLVTVDSSGIISNGTYYLKNMGYEKKYADAVSDGVPANDIIQSNLLLGTNEFKWQFTLGSDGYYTIQSVDTSLYMRVQNDSASAGANVIQSTSTPSGSKWAILISSHNNYVLVPKSSTSSFVVLRTNGSYLSTVLYTNNTTYNDEWKVCTVNVSVQFSYDNGFILRNKIGSESNSTTQARIVSIIKNDYFAKVIQAYAYLCNLHFTLDPTISNYTSDADNCDDSGIDSDCTCIGVNNCLLKYFHDPFSNNSSVGFQYNCHCKNMLRLRNNLIVGIPSDTIRITYTGHNSCCLKSNGSHTYTVIGASDYNHPIISVRVPQSNRQKSILTLAHELAHTYGVVHHPHVDGTFYCIMEIGNQFDWNDPDDFSTYFCDDCIATISSNINKY